MASPGDIMGSQRYIKISLFLFGGLMLGYNLGVYLHELSHAIVMVWLGGSIERIEMNPFSTSYTYYATPSPNPILTSWAGITLGSLLAVLIFGFCLLLNHDYIILLGSMTLIGSLATNGGYAVLDSYITHYGDPAYLIELGVPRGEVAGVGFLLLGLLLLLTVSMAETLGFQPEDGIMKRFVVLGGGIITYFTMDGVIGILFPRDYSETGIYAIPLAVLFVYVTAFLSKLLQPTIKLSIAKPVAELSWELILLTLLLGVGFIGLEYVYL